MAKYTKKHKYELEDEPIKQSNRRFLRIDLAFKNNNGLQNR